MPHRRYRPRGARVKERVARGRSGIMCTRRHFDSLPTRRRWPRRSAGEIVLELESRHVATVRRILEAHVPDLEVRAFGSRVQGHAKPYSDLDLAVMTTSPLPIGIKVRLEHAFTESDLHFKVDVLYWDEIGEGFRRLIEQGWEWIQRSEANQGASSREIFPRRTRRRRGERYAFLLLIASVRPSTSRVALPDPHPIAGKTHGGFRWLGTPR